MYSGAEKANMAFVGGTGTGKTVALCNMWNVLTQNGGIQALGEPDAPKFCLVSGTGKEIKRLQALYDNMSKENKLPIGTNENQKYSFSLDRANETICEIEMLDYRGELAEDTDEGNHDWQEVVGMLTHASIIVYLLPGDVLEKFRIGDKRDANLQAMLVRTIVKNIRRVQSKDNLPPLLFYVTKSDLVSSHADVMEVLEKFIQENDLFYDKVIGCQSTIGSDVVVDETVTPHVIKSGKMEPQGFEIPMLLTVGYSLSEAGENWLKNEVGRLKREIKEMQVVQMNATLTKGTIMSKWNPFTKRKRERQAEKLEDTIDDAERNINKMTDSLNGLPDKNVKAQYAKDIMLYLRNGKFPVLYLDNRTKKDISEFFK
jgi:hypothetical protein